MKKLQNFKPSLVTKEFFPGYQDVSVINEGECFIWAYLAHSLFIDVELWYNGSHAFVKYHGRFYDSEVLRGSPDWADLPATEGGGIPRRVSVKEFQVGWKGQPKWYGTSWVKLERDAQKVIRKHERLLRT